MYFIALLFVFFSWGCASNSKTDEKEIEPKTPVTITNVVQAQLAETIDLRATSVFIVKDNVKSNLSGYIHEVHVILGDYVKKGQLLFTLKTKEASALSVKSNDTTFNFSGIIEIHSPLSGVITTLSKQNGDYVQEGDELAVVAEQSSLVFILEVPYESKKYVKTGISCNITLPGGDVVKGIVNSEMLTVDSESQTQKFILKPMSSSPLPENLVAKVEIVKSVRPSAQTLPKDAVLTDETQTEWWVMKLINDSTAVKVQVKKGIETSDKIEILEPKFEITDKILLTGNYGLPDTSRVVICTSVNIYKK
jgi:biotin carboxyl carrier protein